MPELPEVEVLVRHLEPLLRNKCIRGVDVRRAKILAPTAERDFRRALVGSRFVGVKRRGKYLLFSLQTQPAGEKRTRQVLGHLGMTGRMYLAKASAPLPKHAAVVLNLGRENFVFEDTRYFGRLTLDDSPVRRLGPEPLGDEFTPAVLHASLKRSSQPIKVKLLDQSLLAGVGNIYASEALFRARIAPALPARRLNPAMAGALWAAVREVLAEAIACGSTIPLNFSGEGGDGDRLFYFGRKPGTRSRGEERLRVYDRADHPCLDCGDRIRHMVQAGRSTYYCPTCQPRRSRPRS